MGIKINTIDFIPPRATTTVNEMIRREIGRHGTLRRILHRLGISCYHKPCSEDTGAQHDRHHAGPLWQGR
jgi:hypothetical protein